jgi:SAM-dependent methyltransferase
VPLVRLSADRLPFRSDAFDLVLFFEASYYVPDMERGFDEITRVLAPGGLILFVNANPERTDFIRSPHSLHYHSADDFRAALSRRGFQVDIEGAFPVEASAGGSARLSSRVMSLARRILETLGLVPESLRGRARLKRLVYGKQLSVPAELAEGFASRRPRAKLTNGRARGYKVLYVTARLPKPS